MTVRNCLVVLFLAHSAVGILPTLHEVHSRFEFRHTFKGPHLADAKGNIAFWNYGGDAIPSDDSIRVCPSVKSRRGWVWSNQSFSHSHWMIDVSARVTGRLKYGADGMALWFTSLPGQEGPVYGNSDTWNGLAIFLDSFDNNGMQDNPRIQVVLNDGSKQFQHHTDGLNMESGGCTNDFRNKPYPVKIRITYLRGVLEIWVHDGVSLTQDDYQLCTRLENIPPLSCIPKEGYFGVTAATGGLSDDHDILSFITHSLTPLEEQPQIKGKVDQAEFDKMSEQYSKMAGDFDRRHDVKQSIDGDEYDWQREVEMEQNMKLVGAMQIALQKEIRAVSQKLDLLITGGSAGVDSRRPADAVSNSLSAEISLIKNTESNILHQLGDLRSAMDHRVPEGGKATLSEQLQPVYETKALVTQQQTLINDILTHLKSAPQHQCPPVTGSQSCLSPWLFMVVIVMQIVVFLGYSIYKQTQERNAKKFF